jgi:nucleoside-diphosphate-sugar epimerase
MLKDKSFQISGKKILVTGASGFIGSLLCRHLINCEAEIHAISRVYRSSHNNRLHWWQGDMGSIETVRKIFNTVKPNLIYHLASYVMGAPNLENVLPTFHNNLQTTVNLLTVAAEIGCDRIVLTGSLAEPEPNQDELFPSCPYAAAKCASSAYSRMFHALYQLPVVNARVFMVYGPGQKDLSKLIPYVILSLLKGKAPKITSGERLIDWIYVNDVVEGFIAMGCASGIEGHTIELGSGKLITIREIVQRIVTLIDTKIEPLFGAIPDRPAEPVRVADIKGANARIGWRPTTNLDKGLMLTVEWFREHLHKPT